MKYRLLPFIALLAFTQSACTQFAGTVSPKGVDASDDELLRTLASLAKRGSDAVCNPATVEKELGIKFGEFKIDKTLSLAGEPREGQVTDAVTNLLSGRPFKAARYYRGRSNQDSGCGLNIQFYEQRFCYASTTRVEELMGAPAEVGPARPHGTGYGYFYQYAALNGNISVVWVGQSDGSCGSAFRLTTNGEWK